MADFGTSDIDSTMDKVVKQIYSSCDPENTNCVSVSILIDFVKPYMPENLNELQELQSQLDPEGRNLGVSANVFYDAMKEWTSQLKERDSDDSFYVADPNRLTPIDDRHLPFMASTPRQSIGYNQLVKNCSEILNMSNVSSYENKFDNTEKTDFEDKNKELQHQVQKATNELFLVRQQLAVAEEQNEGLLADINRINKSLHSEQQITEQLKKNKIVHDDIKEENSLLKKKIQQFEKKNANFEKEYHKLLEDIERLESMNVNLDTKLSKCQEREHEAKKLAIDLKTEIELKDTEVATLQKITDELKFQLDQKNELITFYSNENELVKHKTMTLEKMFHEKCAETDESIISQLFRTADSNEYNSSKLLNQIAHPISPNFSPILTNKTTSPKNQPTNKLLKQVLLKNTSTPVDERPFNFTLPPNFSPNSEESDTKDGNSPPVMYVVNRSLSPIKKYSGTNKLYLNTMGTQLRPPKSLKDELIELSDKENLLKHDDGDKIKNDLKEQEEIKNLLWQNIQSLQSELEEYKHCKVEYEEMLRDTRLKDEVISELRSELSGRLSIHSKVCQTDEDLGQLSEDNARLKNDYKCVLNKCTNLNNKMASLKEIIKSLSAKLHNRLTFAPTTDKNVGEIDIVNQTFQLEEMVDALLKQLDEQRLSNINVSAGSSFTKLQMKIDRLTDKIELLERDNRMEKSRCENFSDLNNQLTTDCEVLKVKLQNLSSQQIELRSKNMILTNTVNGLREEQANLTAENTAHRTSVQNLINDLAIERANTGELTKQFYNQQNQYMYREMQWKQQNSDLQQVNVRKILDMENILQERETQLLARDSKIHDSWVVLSMRNTDLERILKILIEHLKNSSNGNFDGVVCEFNELVELRALNFAMEIGKMTRQIKLLDRLVEIIGGILDRFQESSQRCSSSETISQSDEIETSHCKSDDSFNSCLSEIQQFGDLLEEFPSQMIYPAIVDTLIDKLEIAEGDLENLSKQDMEEKFNILFLALTIEIPTLKVRSDKQKDLYAESITNYFKHLTVTVEMVKASQINSPPNGKVMLQSVLKHLAALKTVTSNLFELAEQHGVLQYEMRTMKCWSLVKNYVAFLVQEKHRQQPGSDTQTGDEGGLRRFPRLSSGGSVSPICSRKFLSKKIKCCVFAFFMLLFLIFLVFGYVNWLCLSLGGRFKVCPSDWIFDLIFERTYTDDMPF